MKTYYFTDDSYLLDNGCSCCEASLVLAYNSSDTDPCLGTAHSEEDCWVQAIITEIGRENIHKEYEQRLYDMPLDDLKLDAAAFDITVEILE